VKRARSDSQFLETIRAIQPVKIFGRESERLAVWQNLQAEAINADVRTAQLQIAYQACLGLVTGLEYVTLVWLGARGVLDHALSVGMLMAFLSYRLMFSQRCQTLTDKLIEYRMLGVHLLRLSDIALAEPEAFAGGQGIAAERVCGEITLRNVGFRYSPDDPWLFRHLDFTVKPGECVAFSGRTGQGKTTLLKVMMGLLPPSEGEVLLDGVDIRHIGRSAYRSLCAAVMQDDSLVSGSLRDNICFYDAQPDVERIAESAELACFNRDVAQMPMGYESLIGDMGTALSGGQQQRVLLARALYHQPRILFLDEATSALDAATESRVNANVRQLGITRVIIAHRKETLALADRVVDLAEFSDETWAD
jgi:ATP-binding cassette subfamily B protein RaxB